MTICFFPRVWAKGSSKSGGLLYIFTCSHLHIVTCSHTHTFSFSHPSHLHISYLHIFTSSYLHISLPSHLHIFTSSRLRIFTSSHLHIFSPSHLHIFTSSHLAHLHIFSSSHLLIFSSSLSLSCPLSRSLSFFFFSLLRPQAVPTRRHDMATLSHEMRFECPKLMFFCDFTLPAATLSHESSRVKSWCFFASLVGLAATFRTKRGSSVKNGWFFCDFTTSAATLSREMRFECQKLTVFCDFGWSGDSAGVCV